MKKQLFIPLLLAFVFALPTGSWGQSVIDFESSQIDVLADGAYQSATPFFPGVVIETMDNTTGVLTGWPVVVRAREGSVYCGIGIPVPEGTVGAFDSRYCGTGNTTGNYPVPSGYNSLSDTSEGLPPVAGTPRKQDGFLITFEYPVTDFSVSFADWGDYFPNPDSVETYPSYIELIAYDKDGNSFGNTLSTQLNAADSSRDAANSNGIITLYLPFSYISKVEIRFKGKIDPGVAIDDITFTEMKEEYDLCAGQNDKVGSVVVWNDSDTLYVKYDITDPDTCLLETHLHVAEELGDIPQTKKGNPIPGHFDYKMEHNCVTEYTYSIPLTAANQLFIAAHAVVQMPSSGTVDACANGYSDFTQGPMNDGNPVSTRVFPTCDAFCRVNPGNAFGPPDSEIDQHNRFFSLGFGGNLVLAFPSFVSGDLTVTETSWGGLKEEKANVYVSRDGADWTLLGEANNLGTFDSTDTRRPTTFPLDGCVQYVKIVDTTNIDLFPYPSILADAFDVDAVCASNVCEEETAWGDGCEGSTFNEKNWATCFTYMVQQLIRI